MCSTGWRSGSDSSGPLLGIVGLCYVLGFWWGLLAAGLHLFMYVFVLSSSINGLCHYIGYRNFDNTATNIRWVALLTGGEGLHNNHHGHPRSPKFSFRPSEIDPSWPIIRLLIALRLAIPTRPSTKFTSSRSVIRRRMLFYRSTANATPAPGDRRRASAAPAARSPRRGGRSSAPSGTLCASFSLQRAPRLDERGRAAVKLEPHERGRKRACGA